LLIKYFMDKGFSDSFSRHIHPSAVQDLPQVIPILTSKVEIVPHAAEVDPYQGKAVLSWNLFVLGIHRMYLGDTYHNNLHDLARILRSGNTASIQSDSGSARRQTTPLRIVSFITRVLGDHEAGYVDLRPSAKALQPIGEPNISRHTIMNIPSNQHFGRMT